MKTRLIHSWISALLFAMVSISCEDQDGSGMARVEVRLTDAPGDYEAVIVDIQDVQVKSSEDTTGSGWISLDVNKGKYDLLQLTDGLDTLLGTAQIPAGRVSQVRLVLGDENTIQVDGEVHDLKTPSAQQSGLKIVINENFEAGNTYTILLDFDAARSVIATGNGKFNLKPVIRANVEGPDEEEETGISGKVVPPASRSVIYAIMGDDSTSTQADTVSGNFLVGDLAVGTYTVSIVPGEGFVSREIHDVEVEAGEVNNLGTIVLENN